MLTDISLNIWLFLIQSHIIIKLQTTSVIKNNLKELGINTQKKNLPRHSYCNSCFNFIPPENTRNPLG